MMQCLRSTALRCLRRPVHVPAGALQAAPLTEFRLSSRSISIQIHDRLTGPCGALSGRRDNKKQQGGKSVGGKGRGANEAAGGAADAEGEAWSEESVRTMLAGPLDALRKSFETLRAVRAGPGLFDKVQVPDADGGGGGTVPLASVASVSVKEPTLLHVTLFDAAYGKAVEKALRETRDLPQLTVELAGSVLAVRLPKQTKESRDALAKTAERQGEAAKVSVRGVRQKALDAARKGGLSKDELRTAEKQIQARVDEATKTIERLTEAKVKEISTF